MPRHNYVPFIHFPSPQCRARKSVIPLLLLQAPPPETFFSPRISHSRRAAGSAVLRDCPRCGGRIPGFLYCVDQLEQQRIHIFRWFSCPKQIVPKVIHSSNCQTPFKRIQHQIPFLLFHNKLASFGLIVVEGGELVECAGQIYLFLRLLYFVIPCESAAGLPGWRILSRAGSWE